MSRTGQHSLRLPRPMAIAPALDPNAIPAPLRRRYALLINPFYPQGPARQLRQARADADARADEPSPAATPADWNVSYWDENLLQGPPPLDPFPQVVGDHRAPHVRRARVRAGALVSAAGREGRARRAARACRAPRKRRRTPTRSRSARACSSGRRFSATSRRARCSPSTAATIASRIATIRRRAATCCRATASSRPRA